MALSSKVTVKVSLHGDPQIQPGDLSQRSIVICICMQLRGSSSTKYIHSSRSVSDPIMKASQLRKLDRKRLAYLEAFCPSCNTRPSGRIPKQYAQIKPPAGSPDATSCKTSCSEITGSTFCYQNISSCQKSSCIFQRVQPSPMSLESIATTN